MTMTTLVMYQPTVQNQIVVQATVIWILNNVYHCYWNYCASSLRPKQLEATVEWLAKSGKEMKKLIRLREVNIGIDRHGNIIR